MSDDGGVGAIGLISAMGIVYWVAYFGAMVLLGALVVAAVAIVVILVGAIWFVMYAEKPGLLGWLIFLPAATAMASIPHTIMFFTVFDRSFKSRTDVPGYANVVGPVCFFLLLYIVFGAIPRYYKWVLRRF